MRKRTFACLALTALLLLATTQEESLAGRRRRARRCCPPCRTVCPSCPSCQKSKLIGCICPYFDMGGFWYAERFDNVSNGSCGIGEPTAHPNGPEGYCSGGQCYNCAPASDANKIKWQNCDKLYLRECLEPGAECPCETENPYYKVETICLWRYAKITTIEGSDPGRDIYVAIYKKKIIKCKHCNDTRIFYVGFECTKPRGGILNVSATQVIPGCNAVVKIEEQKGIPKDVIVKLTKNGCR